MEKSIQRIAKMNFKKGYKLSFLAVILLTGCVSGQALWERESTVLSVAQEERPCGDSVSALPVVVPPENVNGRFVNYRQSAANYREYGERTPQDQYITSAGAGNNMSAAIPPTIEEEVVDYEEAVNEVFNSADGSVIDDSGESSGDDAVEDWLAEEGNTLKGLLSDWCERAGWRLVWNSNRNYTLGAGAMFRGRFADVSSALIRNFARAKPAPMATFYKGNRVLVVETREDENAYN